MGKQFGFREQINTHELGNSTSYNTDHTKGKVVYAELLLNIERLHRRLMDAIRDEFSRIGCELSPIQVLLLFDIGTESMSLSELKERGCYLNSSMSYNLRKMIACEYVKHERSSIDRRTIRVSVSPKGREIIALVGKLYDRHLQSLYKVSGVSASDLMDVNKKIIHLDRFLRDQVLYHL